MYGFPSVTLLLERPFLFFLLVTSFPAFMIRLGLGWAFHEPDPSQQACFLFTWGCEDQEPSSKMWFSKQYYPWTIGTFVSISVHLFWNWTATECVKTTARSDRACSQWSTHACLECIWMPTSWSTKILHALVGQDWAQSRDVGVCWLNLHSVLESGAW